MIKTAFYTLINKQLKVVKTMLNKKQLKQLRKEIVLNSIYLKDYDNTLFIKNKTVCDFFDSYIEYLYEIASEKNIKVNDNNYYDVINKLDTINNLYDYYSYLEYDPLLNDDFIASKAINNSDSVVIYQIDDVCSYNPYIKVAYYYLDGLYMNTSKIKTLKLYDSVKRGYYFILDKRRYYIDDFMRVNYGR